MARDDFLMEISSLQIAKKIKRAALDCYNDSADWQTVAKTVESSPEHYRVAQENAINFKRDGDAFVEALEEAGYS